MYPVVFTVGPIIISTSSLFAALGFLVASFFLWRQLKEDYLEEDILSFAIFLVLGAILGARLFWLVGKPDLYFQPFKWVSLRKEPGLSFLGGFVFLFLILSLWTRKKSWDFWLVADNLTRGFFLFLVISEAGLFLARTEEFIFLLFLISLLALFLSFFFARNYRRFVWYKSGKPGFVTCLTLGIFWIILGGLEIIFQKGIYWERGGIFVLAFLSLIFLYKRSERVLKEDIKMIISFFKNQERKNEK